VRGKTPPFDRGVWRNARWGARVGILIAMPVMSACAGSRPDIALPAPRHSLEGTPVAAEHVVVVESPPATRVTGEVRFLDSAENEPDLGAVVVYLVFNGPTRPVRRTNTRPPLIVTSRSTVFDPALAAVGGGQPVVFANEGPLSHTLFSADLPGARFELPPGTRTRGIDLPPRGPIRFFCSLHSDESFVVFAGNTEYIAVVEGRSPYSLGPVEAGSYTLSIWSELVSGPVRKVVVDGYSRAIEPIWIDPALVRHAPESQEGSP